MFHTLSVNQHCREFVIRHPNHDLLVFCISWNQEYLQELRLRKCIKGTILRRILLPFTLKQLFPPQLVSPLLTYDKWTTQDFPLCLFLCLSSLYLLSRLFSASLSSLPSISLTLVESRRMRRLQHRQRK